MKRILRQILIFVLIAVILFTNINISQAASVVRSNDFYQVKSEQGNTTGRKNTANQRMTVDLSESTDKKSVQKTAVKKSSISKTVDQKNTMQKVTDEKSNISNPTDKENDVQKTVADSAPQETASEKQDKQEENSQKDEGATDKSEGKEETKEEEQSTGTKKEVFTSEEKEISKKTSTENTEQEKEEEANTELKKEQKNTGTGELFQKEIGYSLRTVRPDTNHSVTMPDITSHYFLLQKNSKKVSAASGANLAVVADAQAASKYIYESYPNGKQYNFTPRFTNKTVVKVGGGTGGGVSFATVKKGPQKQFGDVYDAVTESRIASKVFNLDKCSENPYAIYANVGTWYDYSSKRTYAIDMKITVTGYKFPGAAIRKQLANQQLKAPYVGFTKSKIGMIVMGTDYLQTRMEFYYNGTTTAVSGIKGMIQFCDIDAQQGVDFGNGFEKIVMFKTAQTKLQYNKNGLIAGSKGYVSSRTSEDLNSNNEHTTAMGIFAGSSVNCRWTVAKCDQKDTGGNAAYGVSGGYGIPADSTIKNSNSYYWSNSTGFLGVRADVGIAPLPEEVIKSIYAGRINGQNSEKGTKFLGLPERDTVFSYVLSSAAPTPSDVKNARYTAFQFEDSVDALLNVKSVKVYADEAVSNNFQTMGIQYSDMTSYFTITKKEEADHRTTVVVKALAARLTKAAFYGRTYYVHIEAEVKTDEQLHSIGRSIADWYQKDESIRQKVPEAGSCRGTVAVSNMGSLLAQNNKGSVSQKKSNDVASKIAMRLSVKKSDEESGKPVKGVVFGLFGGESTEPLYRATTDENGVAAFKPTSYTCYKEEFGDGPYYVKEISIPEKYKNVWNPSLNRNWTYKIDTLKTEELFSTSIFISEKQQLVNKNYEAKKHLIKVYKKSKDTGAYLSGAEFVLSEWSDSAGKYNELFTLEEAKDKSGYPIYWNEKTLKNTLDNLGKYKITEKKAPKGCILTGQEWGFTLSENTKEDGSNIIFENLATGKRQTSALIYRNPLQKGKIILTKKDDEEQVVAGATFTVKAAEDIYAPWDVDEQNKAEKDAEPLISKGTVADIITTGKDGKAESTSGNELYIGKYTVEETGGAIDHIKGDGIYEIELAYGMEADNPFVVYYLDVSNRLMRPAFAIAKLADKTTNVEGKEVSFNEKSGRYTEKKKSGIYKAGQMVDYTIRVTNTGNVPLYQIRLTDDMDGKGMFAEQTLSKYADMETATFVIPDSGGFKTREGDKVAAKLSLESDLVVTLHHLNVNDSLDIHVRVQLKEDAKDAWQLRNDVHGEAKYNDNDKEKEEDGTGDSHLKEVPVENLIDGDGNSLIRDWDFINIPGKPGEKVTKTADKTTGVTIENGEITSGSKVPGIYNAAEKVKFSITVKNNGEAALKNITVKDAMSEELKAIADMETAGFVFGQTETTEDGLYVLTTAGKKKITAKVIDKDTVLLCSTGENGDGTDRLWAEDYIVLNYEVDLLPGIANFYNLSNKAYINGWYFDGNMDVEVPGQEDEDKIEVPGMPEGRTAKLADKTKGAVLEEGRYKAEAKISGIYENGNTVTYKITVTNTGTANLYDLYLKDTLSPVLENALEKNSVSFEEKVYTSQDGRKVRTVLEEPQKLWMDFLGAKDSVDVFLKGKVRLDVGNLFELENLVELTARYKKGNEEAYKKYEEKVEKENRTWKLEYDANNGSNTVEIDSETPCQEGKRVTVNGNPFSYSGYYFTGWNTKADGSGEMWKPDDIYTMPAKDIRLYAQWKKEKKEDEKDDGKEDGKNDEKEENSRKNPVYNLIYDSNNIKNQVESDEENSQLAGVLLTVNKNHFSYPGFTFTGWNTRKDGKGKKYIEEDTLTMPAKDMILYAQWKKNPVYHLVYDANNESGMRRTDAETPCEAGTSIQIDGNSYHYEKGKGSYAFTGWNTRPDGQGEEYKAGEEKEIHADVVLYAQWERLPENAEDIIKYHVFYRANNNTTAFSVDAQTPEEVGKDIVLEKNRFSYTDHVFTGWNTKADGSGKAYKPEEVFSVPSKDISLYAQWRKIERKTLVYSSNTKEEERVTDAECFTENGKEDAPDNSSDKEQRIELDGNAFHNNGLAFTGWNTSPDGTGKAYAPGEKFVLKEDTILYAQWSQNVKTYALTYHSNYPADADNKKDEQKEMDSETPAYAGTKVKINKNYFSYSGYMFMGWSTKKTGVVEYIPSQWHVMPEQDVNLYACWEKKPEEDKSDKKEDTEKPGEKEDMDDKKDDSKDDGLKDEENSDKDNNKDNGNEDNKQDDNNKEDTDKKEESLPEQTKKAIEQAYEEIQKLALKELKEESEKYTEIPVTELMKDTDIINIPGTPVTKVAKLADKTQGVTLIKGRYEGEKKEGIYEYGDIVDYTINITNAGTADLYDLSMEDCMDNALLENIEKDSVQIETGELTTRQKNKVYATRMTEKEDKPGKYVVQFDCLKSGDSLELHIKGKIKSGVQANIGLNNTVHITAQYETVNDDGKKEKVYVTDTPEMTDDDTVGIGVPEIRIAKKADKTKNITLEDGRYTGKRQYGTYKTGEEIKFTLTVSNRGTAAARKIKVTEEPSEELRKYVQMKGFIYKVGSSIQSKQKYTVKVEECKNKAIFLDKIEAGDTVELIYTAKVKKDIPSIKCLKNEVTLTGKHKDGTEIPLTSKMKDYDKVNLKEDSKAEKGSQRHNTKGNGAKTGDHSNLLLWSFLSIISLSTVMFLIYYTRRKNNKG